MEEYPKNRNRYFIHDGEIKEMENSDKQKLIEQFSKNNSPRDYNLKRLDIAKELLMAQLSNPSLPDQYKTISDMVDDAIFATDLLLERTK